MGITKINDEDLEDINGGLIFDAIKLTGPDKKSRWQVLDDRTGEIK